MVNFNKKEYIQSLKSLHPADQADSIEKLNLKDQTSVLKTSTKNLHPDFIAYLREETREEILNLIPKKQLINLIKYLDLDDAVEILSEFETKDLVNTLSNLGQLQRSRIEENLKYPEDSAGRIMNRDFLAVKSTLTVGNLIDQLRNSRRGPKDFYNVFIVDENNIPIGYIPSGRILRSKRSKKLKDMIFKNVHLIKSNESVEDIAYTFRQYGLVSAPVVSTENKILGIITVDDVVEVIEEEREEDILKLGGVGHTDIYNSVIDTTKSRLSWLIVNLMTAIVASIVIGLFEAAIEKVVALAILMPIVASMGANAGTQTLAVAVRALAVKELTPSNALKIITKETFIGGINGIIFAIIISLLSIYWFQDFMLGLIIGSAMVLNLIIAGFAGTIIPLALDKMKIDPALASAVILSTITDVFGFLSFLGLATLFLI